MPYRRFFRRFFGWLKDQRLLALATCCVLAILSLPLTGLFLGSRESTVIGIPSYFFVMTLAAPLAGWAMLAAYSRLAEDNDRHDPALENE